MSLSGLSQLILLGSDLTLQDRQSLKYFVFCHRCYLNLPSANSLEISLCSQLPFWPHTDLVPTFACSETSVFACVTGKFKNKHCEVLVSCSGQKIHNIQKGTFRNLLGPSETFRDLQEPSGTFWNLLKPSGSLEFQIVHRQTYLRTSRGAPLELKIDNFMEAPRSQHVS